MDEQTTPTTERPSTDTPAATSQPLIPYRDDSFFETYANNVNFQSSVWDLSAIFAVLDQTPGKGPFKQVGLVRLPWKQAKLMAYFLLVNIVFHEESNGPISIPAGVTPAPIDSIFKDLPDDPKRDVMVARINRLRTDLGL